MAHPERPIHPADPRFSFISMASMLTGEIYGLNNSGLQEATTALRTQHAKISLQMAPETLRRTVETKDPVIKATEESAVKSIKEGDFEAALESANYLNEYAEIDYKDSLGGEALQLSLETHRLFAATVLARYSDVDPFLKRGFPGMVSDITYAAATKNFAKELELIRGMIHMTALNGTLGEGAKQKFDPFAIGTIE